MGSMPADVGGTAQAIVGAHSLLLMQLHAI
jgi:hypothetical protein